MLLSQGYSFFVVGTLDFSMNKFFKSLIITVICSIACFFVACGKERVVRIRLSLPNVAYDSSTSTYIMEKTDLPQQIHVDILPSSFTAQNLTWNTNAQNVVTVDSLGFIRTRGAGKAMITASYRNGSGDITKGILRIEVTINPLPKFLKEEDSIDYAGKDIKDNFRVFNEDEDVYEYKYYDFTDGQGKEVDGIENAGKYRIEYCRVTDGMVYAKMMLTVNPAKITLPSVNNGESFYGDSISMGFISSSSTISPEDYENGYNLLDPRDTERNRQIGKYVLVVDATDSSNSGQYAVRTVVKLNDADKRNYIIEGGGGRYTINPKKVVVEIQRIEVSYGSDILPKYTLYDDSTYGTMGKVILSSEKYTKNIAIARGSYVLKQGGRLSNRNPYRNYDSGKYEITYDIGDITIAKNNLDVTRVIPGELVIQKRSVLVEPKDNHKLYGEEDPVLNYEFKNLISNASEIQPFLLIDYSGDYGDGNKNAPVRDYPYYPYKIDTDANLNYSFELVENPRPFKILKCTIAIEFQNKTDNYHKPQNGDDPVVGYYRHYNQGRYDYLLDLASVKINGVERVESITTNAFKPDGQFNLDGQFCLETGEIFTITLNALDKSLALPSDPNLVASYTLSNISVNFLGNPQDSGNFDFTLITSTLNLTKTHITIRQNLDKDMETTYGSGEELSLSNTFLLSYDCFDDGDNMIDKSTIFAKEGEVLTFQNQDKQYEVQRREGMWNQFSEFGGWGKYKVFLSPTLNSNIQKDSKEYYDFTLDEEHLKYFVIKKCIIQVTPRKNQSKIYGNADGVIKYDASNVPSGVESQGELARAPGEDVRTYSINVGSLSFGENCSIEFINNVNTEEIEYRIEQRPIDIEPNSYTIFFGDRQPELHFKDIDYGTYDKDILIPAVFDGIFEINADKVGELYKCGTYDILQGSFKCIGNNYKITFNTSGKYDIRRREIIINITSSELESYNGGSGDDVTLTSDKFSIENLPNASDFSVSNITISHDALNPSSSSGAEYFFVNSISALNFRVMKGGIDVTDCFNPILGQNIVYSISTKVICLKLTINGGSETYKEVEYNGGSFKNDSFRLVCTTDGYELEQDKSAYSLEFTLDDVVEEPIRAGSYIATIKQDGISLFIKDQKRNDEFSITALDTNQAGYIAHIIGTAELKIDKTRINVKTSSLAFEHEIGYGSDSEDLSDIKTEVDGIQIFTGVNGESLVLKKDATTGRNYILTSSYMVSSLEVSKTPYKMAVKVESEDPNYEPAFIEVPLYVLPKEIVVSSEGSITVIPPSQDELVYTGTQKFFKADLSVDNEEDKAFIRDSYDYVKFETIYDDNNVSSISYKLEDDQDSWISGDLNVLEGVFGEAYMYIIGNDDIMSVYSKAPSSNITYIKLPKGGSSSRSPKNAGFYVVHIKFNPMSTDYIFSYNGEDTDELETFYCFEIKRSTKEIQFVKLPDGSADKWQEEFYFGTKFNLDDPQSLPFVFDLVPDFKSKVKFKAPAWGTEQWGSDNPCPQMGTYTVYIMVNEPNYYFKGEKQFKIIKCKAEITLPIRNQFSYIDRDRPVTSFLYDIRVTLKDKDENVEVGEEVIKYTSGDTRFSFTYYKCEDGKDVGIGNDPPCDIGAYKVHIEFSSDTHDGSADYTYYILSRNFSGQISIPVIRIEYRPNLTSAWLYDKIKGMITINTMHVGDVGWDELVKTLRISYQKADRTYEEIDESNAINVVMDDNVDSTKPNNISLKFEIDFQDDTITPEVQSTMLNIEPVNITSYFRYKDENDSGSYTPKRMENYSGFKCYNELKFVDSNTDPSAPLTINLSPGEKNIDNGVYSTHTNKEESSVIVNDATGNLVFKVTYTYSLWNQGGVEIGSHVEPIRPNVNGEQYKTTYTIEVGSKYKILGDEEGYVKKPRWLTITKLPTLYISCTPRKEVDYNGQNWKDDILSNLKVSDSSTSPQIQMNYSLIYNPELSSTSFKYDESKGVVFAVKIVDSSGHMTTEVKSAGVYTIKISLFKDNEYVLKNFFDNVVINANSTAHSTAEYTQDNSGTPYFYSDALSLSLQFTINKAMSPYMSVDSLSNFWEVGEGTYYEVQDNNKIYINSSTVLTIKEENSNFEIWFKDADGNPIKDADGNSLELHDVRDLDPTEGNPGTDMESFNEYSMTIVDNEGNYLDSITFIVRKLKAPPPEETQ